MLKTSGRFIINESGEKVHLTGIALGGWLMMEGYMLGGRNIPEHTFKQQLGPLVRDFTHEFRNRFLTPQDAQTIKKLGFNCVRIPFNFRILEEEGWGIEALKTIVSWFTDIKIYVILDMHAAPGAQNCDWHSDSEGKAELFEKEEHQKHYHKLWDLISKAFKDSEYIAGYDVMNEPVTDKVDVLKQVYAEVIKVIRKNGDQHIIFLEGNKWAREVDFLSDLLGENIALSVHFYEPTQFTFNYFSNLTYPGRIDNVQWNKYKLAKLLKPYARFKVPVYVGEFGIASRCPHCKKEYDWVRDVLRIFKDYGFHWTYWTYKSVGGMNYPDGLYQLFDHTEVVGPETEHPGMENILLKLKEDPQKVYNVLDTKKFILNQKLMRIIENYLC
ncbi:glycoside hydrolase family 5 protein [Candidatus Saganbacteria bacterium]|nr:glycoside hydrolase family 5 protein [Candidatus Saganbacteria bacterium]